MVDQNKKDINCDVLLLVAGTLQLSNLIRDFNEVLNFIKYS